MQVQLFEFYVCPKVETTCHQITLVLNDKTIIGGDNVKCWKNWCYVIGIPYNIYYSNGTSEINKVIS